MLPAITRKLGSVTSKKLRLDSFNNFDIDYLDLPFFTKKKFEKLIEIQEVEEYYYYLIFQCQLDLQPMYKRQLSINRH